ncbi:MAG: asparagine synthase (glutamine-hydrolyzing) [Phycisphaerae bacterium]
MCGIAGIVTYDGLREVEREALPAMGALLRHRGPDDAGRHVDRYAGLAHRRLSIIDHQSGRQPMGDGRGRWIVFNGEIYNFRELRAALQSRGCRFRTESDTEVILHAYDAFGDDCLEHLRGMFAIAIWDAPRRRLLLARDRLGVKPLYYALDDRRIIFGSELKAVTAAPGVATEIDVAALADYLAFHFIPSPGTIFRSVQKLEPGQRLIYERGRARIQRYWELSHSGWHSGSSEEIAEALWDHLGAATADRLVADVPLGGFLSGGVDSAAVTVLAAAQCRDRLTTCTVGFDERDFDERAAARRLALQAGTRHIERVARTDVTELLPRLAWHFDEPFADASALPTYVLSGIARRHMTVALSGDGGDEVLAGYRRYRFDLIEDAVRRRTPNWLRPVAGTLGRVYPQADWLPRPLRARATLVNLGVDAATAHARSLAQMTPADFHGLIHPDLRAALRDYDPLDHVRRCYAACDAPDHLARCQYVDMRLSLADGILTKVDRASMAHGLEVRSPLLDHRLVEFAASIPPAQRMKGRHGKAPLRIALAKRFGDDVAWRTKQGFSVPLDRWFADPRTDMAAALETPCDLLDAQAVRRLIERQRRGRQRCGAALWALVMLGEWRRQQRRSTSATEAPRSADHACEAGVIVDGAMATT